MIKNNNPWMASSAYQEADSFKFKGRDKDTQQLLTMLLQNESVICYAASGDGKSSLINAGVCPGLRKNGLFPIKITFTTAEFEEKGLHDFDKLIADKINDEIDRNIKTFIEKYHIAEGEYTIAFEKIPKYKNVEIPNSMWWKLRTETIQIPFGEYDYIPVLIFDQFEEIFRAKWKAEFFKWLEELMRDVCPNHIVAKFNGSNDDLPNGKLFKTLFSMRYEYVGELDYWCSQKTYIPQMMLNRYFLKPLSLKQAISIIENQDTEDEISNKLRNSSALIANGIKNKETDEDEVSAIILSIVCYELYEELSSKPGFSINEGEINGVINQIISSFYENAISGIGIPPKHLKIIENVLVDEKGHRLRLPVDISDLKDIDFDSNYREALVAAHLIRSYKVNDETYVELIHDRIAEVIVEKRKIEQNKNQKLLNIMKIAILILALIGIILGTTWYNQNKNINNLEDQKEDLINQIENKLININLKEDDAVRGLWWEATLLVTAKNKTSDTILIKKINKTQKDSSFVVPIKTKITDSLFISLEYTEDYKNFFERKDTIEHDSIPFLKFITLDICLKKPIYYGGQVVMSDSIGKATNHQIENAIVILGNDVTFTDGQGNFLFELHDSAKRTDSIIVIRKDYKTLSNLTPSDYIHNVFPKTSELKQISLELKDSSNYNNSIILSTEDVPRNKEQFFKSLKNGKIKHNYGDITVIVWQKDLSIKYEGKYQSNGIIHLYLIFTGDPMGYMKVRGHYFYGKEETYSHWITKGSSKLHKSKDDNNNEFKYITFELESEDIANNKETIKGKYYPDDEKRPWELNIFINDTKKIAESVIPDQ